PENGAARRMRKQMTMQPQSEVWTRRQPENSFVVNDARADITAAQGNDPAPPAMTHQMISRPFPARAAGIHHLRKFFAPFIAIPLLRTGETRPYRVNRMLGVRTIMAQLACDHCRAPARVHYPARAKSARLLFKLHRDRLLTTILQIEGCHFRRPQQFAPGRDRLLQQVAIEGGP